MISKLAMQFLHEDSGPEIIVTHVSREHDTAGASRELIEKLLPFQFVIERRFE